MDTQELLTHIPGQFDRILAFFTRVEAKAAALFAVDLGILGFMASSTRVTDAGYFYVLVVGATVVILIGMSIWFLYWTFYPDLHQGVSTSSAYFGHIAKFTRDNYIEHMQGISQEEYARDMLDQVWRNSDILQKKFHYVKKAFLCTALALPFWFEFLIMVALLHTQTTL